MSENRSVLSLRSVVSSNIRKIGYKYIQYMYYWIECIQYMYYWIEYIQYMYYWIEYIQYMYYWILGTK